VMLDRWRTPGVRQRSRNWRDGPTNQECHPRGLEVGTEVDELLTLHVEAVAEVMRLVVLARSVLVGVASRP